MNVPGLNKVRAKGRIYFYHRKSGIRIKAAPGTPEFFAEIRAAEESVKGRPGPAPGTLEALIEAYRHSPFWSGLAPKTRLSYDRAIAALGPVHKAPLATFTPEFVASLRDKIGAKRGRWMANYVLTVSALLFDFARERGWMDANPSRQIRRFERDRALPRANRPWSPAECRTVLDAAPPYLRVPIALAMFAGFRKGDVLTVTKAAVSGDLIKVRTSKRGRDVKIPVHPTLANVLAGAPKHEALTLAANSRGESWTESGFNSTFGKFIDALETAEKVEPGLTMHGLRHTLGTRLKEAGAEDRAIADILGQASLAMAHHYSDSADTSDRDRSLIEAADLFGERAKAQKKRKPKRA